jgi:hypothetical protein
MVRFVTALASVIVRFGLWFGFRFGFWFGLWFRFRFGLWFGLGFRFGLWFGLWFGLGLGFGLGFIRIRWGVCRWTRRRIFLRGMLPARCQGDCRNEGSCSKQHQDEQQ